MADVISDYQKWKEQGENLKMQAKQAMELRFRELLTQAAALAEEFRADFGATLKPPANITAFRYKAAGKSRPKKTAKPPAPKASETPRPEPPKPSKPSPSPNPKVAGLQKKLLTAQKKLEGAKAAGTPTRNLEDRVYEIEDALRLAGQPG